MLPYNELFTEYEGLKQVIMHHTGTLCDECRKHIEAWDRREYQRALVASKDYPFTSTAKLHVVLIICLSILGVTLGLAIGANLTHLGYRLPWTLLTSRRQSS